MPSQDFDAIDLRQFSRLAANRTSRRRFIGGGAAAAAALAMGGSFLAACSKSDNKSATGTTATQEGPATGTLRISNWPLYMADGFVAEFQKASGLTVDYKEDFNDNEQWFAKVKEPLSRKQDIGADLVVPTQFMAARINRLGWLNEISDSGVPNRKNLRPDLLNSQVDPGRKKTAPYMTGMVGLAYNKAATKRDIATIDDLWDPAFKEHVAIEKVPATYGVDTLIMAARLAGGDEHDIEPGFKKLRELKPNLGAIYTNSSQCQQLFQQGGTWIAPWYSGRVASTARSGVPVKAASTKEGEPVYLTMLCPLKGRYNPWVAKFMEMHLSPEVQQAFAREFASGPSRTDVKLEPDIAKNVPYGQEQVSRLIQFDWDKIIPRLDEWTQRFNREIAS